nr:hypothetical protein [Halobacterium sp. TGN-42-S1]
MQVQDPIENAQFELYTDSVVDPVRASDDAADDRFALPVDSAVRFEAESIELPMLLNVSVWTQDGTYVGQSANQEVDSYPRRAYALDLHVGPMKLQVAADAPLQIRRAENTTFLEFEAPTPVLLGARSLHESPAGTITIGDDVTDGMRAVSLFGSALKTTSPERSFPTLRGHPPLVERGDGFDAPDHLVAADTDVAIEIHRDWGDLYQVSALAYYLGAEVRPGPERALVLDGDRHVLGTDRSFGDEVRALLEHVFLLDCVVRTEGLYPVDLHERAVLEPDLDVDLAAAYEASLAERLETYLDVPYEVTEPHVPKWKLTADIAPEAKRIESLPFVVNDLARIRIHDPDAEPPDVEEEPEAVTSFLRGGQRSVHRSQSEVDFDTTGVVKPPSTDAIEHVWLADGFPLGASKGAAEYYRRRFEYETPDRDAIRIDIVCNDPEMTEEEVVEEFYGARDFFEFDIEVHYGLSTDELGDLLRTEVDFLHYIGHVEEGGFLCEDGLFDARRLESTGVRAFLLNACRSYIQGQALVDRGSRGGIVTLTDISNDPAVRIGRALARLLNNGFSLLSGLSVARNVTIFGNQYITIGDGSVQLVQSNRGTLTSAKLGGASTGYDITMQAYPTNSKSIGTLFSPHLTSQTTYYLNSGEIGPFTVEETELIEFLDKTFIPILQENRLSWSDEVRRELLD